MKALLYNRWVLLALRIALGGIFVYAGFTKLQQPLNFADSIATFQILPTQLISVIALTLPPLEILTGGMLILGWKIRSASLAMFGLTVIFAVALIQALIRGLEVDCGCFGSGEPSIWKAWISLGRDLLFMSVSAWLYAFSLNREASKPA